MTPEQREELKQAASAATPGPWVHTQFGVLKAGKFAEYTNGSAQEQIGMMCGASWMREGEHHVNANYVALANPAAILSLIAQVEALTVPQVAVSVERGGVYIIKGAQSFRLAYEGETRGEQEWYAGVLRKALAAPTIPAIPGTKEGA